MGTVHADQFVEARERFARRTTLAAVAGSAAPKMGSQPRAKRKLIRRAAPNHSQGIRHAVQWAFVALNVWIGVQFFLWVRYMERGGHGLYVSRPPGVEGWLPIAGLMNLKYLLLTGDVPSIHPAAMFLLMAFLAISVLMKKAFCAWLCPIGTLSENLWKLGRKIFRKSVRVPRWVDIPLRSLKYLLLGFFGFFIAVMPAEQIAGFMQSPYAMVADVKMLNFFRYMGETAALVLLALVALSVVIENFWCRYLCPYGALMGLASLLSPVKIRRDAEACIDCGKCSKACPSHLPVDQLVQIRSVECTACMECVTACPAEHALQFAMAPAKDADVAKRWKGRVVGPAATAAAVVILFVGIVAIAKATGHWQTEFPRAMYMELVTHANQFSH
ncbi:MAG: 4Fe-4S binding protein [Acidobacteriaceae bacterium]